MLTVTLIDVAMNAVMLSVVYIECHIFNAMLNVVMLGSYAYLSLILAKYSLFWLLYQSVRTLPYAHCVQLSKPLSSQKPFLNNAPF